MALSACGGTSETSGSDQTDNLGGASSGGSDSDGGSASDGVSGDGSGGATGGSANSGGAASGGTGGGAASGGTGGGASCDEGEKTCTDSVSTVCTDGKIVSTDCGEGYTCGPADECVPLVCTPGEESCQDNDTPQTCDADGLGYTPGTACEPGNGCVDGGCLPYVCTPNEPSCVDNDTPQSCDADGMGYTVGTACEPGNGCVNGACIPYVCTPNEPSCQDSETTRVCNADGMGYTAGTTCDVTQACEAGGCVALCDLQSATTTEGCSFFSVNMSNHNEGLDGVIVANPSTTSIATVTLRGITGGEEVQIGQSVQVAPLSSAAIAFPAGTNNKVSFKTTGFTFRLTSDLPISVTQHSTLVAGTSNDSSGLLPDRMLGSHYFIASYPDTLSGYPSTLNVVATADGTEVTITPSKDTAAGSGIIALTAGQPATFILNRYEMLQLVNAASGNAADRDLTGTEIASTAPLSVFGGTTCAQVPGGVTYCDHIEEQMLPVATWGTSYVAAPLPGRAADNAPRWRFIAATDDTVIDTNPQLAGFPITLAKGAFHEVASTTPFVATGSQPFAAFQYMTGVNTTGGNGIGDPSMLTTIPSERFLDSYVFGTPSGYISHYVQIVRTTDDAVLIDGVAVDAAAYTTVGAYSVAGVAVSEGTHRVTSATPFGLSSLGYTSASSYAAPAGLELE